MMKKSTYCLLLVNSVILSTSLITGCATRQGAPSTNPAPKTQAVPQAPQTIPPANVQTNNGRIREAQNVASALVGKHNITKAYVFVTDSTAYVAVNIPGIAKGQLTDQIKTDVANEVKRVDPSVQNVYVSADPAVVTRFQGYSNDIRTGHPIAGLYNQFVEFTRRVFPQKR